LSCVSETTFTFTFRRSFYPKRLTYVRRTMYTHFTFSLMAHCTSGAIRGSVSCSRTLRQGIELATFCLLNDLFTSCTTVAPTSNLRSLLQLKRAYRFRQKPQSKADRQVDIEN